MFYGSIRNIYGNAVESMETEENGDGVYFIDLMELSRDDGGINPRQIEGHTSTSAWGTECNKDEIPEFGDGYLTPSKILSVEFDSLEEAEELYQSIKDGSGEPDGVSVSLCFPKKNKK